MTTTTALKTDFTKPDSTSTDLLTQVINQMRPHLARTVPVTERIRTFWAVMVESRSLGATDVVIDEFLSVATETGLIADLGRHGADAVGHVIRQAMHGRDPFGRKTKSS